MKVNTIHPLIGLVRYESWKSGWAKKDEVDEFSYISSPCNPEDVLLSCKLLFPDFVVEYVALCPVGTACDLLLRNQCR